MGFNSIIWTYQLPDHTQESMNLDNEGPLYIPKEIIIVWHLVVLLNIQLHIQCIGGTIKWQMAAKDLANANLYFLSYIVAYKDTHIIYKNLHIGSPIKWQYGYCGFGQG